MSARKTGTVKPVSRSAAEPPVADPAVERAARATVAEADRALDGAITLLTRAGLSAELQAGRVPQSFLLKLAACVRIYQWEQAKLTRHLPSALPTSAEVWDDLLAAPRTGYERFPAKELASKVFGVWFSEMAWMPPSPAADLVVSGLGAGDDVMDELAHLLFEFRHLVKQHRPERPEEE
jgi:hypothetical protein